MLKSDNGKYAAQLIDKGFLKYADSSRIDSLKTHLITEFDIYDEGILKTAHIDAEELAEFNFDFFLPTLNKILSKRDIKLSAQKLDNNDNCYDVLINGDTIQLYTQSALDNNAFGDTGARNFFKKVNELLKAKKIDEQFYLLYGGNDLHAMLLTGKQFSIIAEYYKRSEKDTPYKP